MGIAEIILVAIVGIVVYALYSMRKKPSGSRQHPPDMDSGQAQQRQSFQSQDESVGRGKKSGYAKWVGGGLGWVFGGPIGAILGVALGSMFDGMSSGKYEYQNSPRGNFALSLLVLSAAVMKADQKVVRSELEYVRSFFVNQFGSEEGKIGRTHV